MKNYDEISNKVRKILASQLSLNEASIFEEASIGQDLGADSLDTAEIAMMIKDEFGVDLTDEEIIGIKTVRDIIEIIKNHALKTQ